MSNDFLLCIGKTYYSESAFRSEAQQHGVSRRIHRVPKGLVPGASRVFLAFEAGRDSWPRKCEICGLKPLPDPTCPVCNHAHPMRHAPKGRITGYFIPDRIEVVFVIGDERAMKAIEIAKRLGAADATIDRSNNALRVRITTTNETAITFTHALAEMDGVTPHNVDILAGIVTLPGSQLVGIGHEPQRGCGWRHAGAYIVNNPGLSPIIDIPPIRYDGQHFRGIRKLSDQEKQLIGAHIAGLCNGTIAAA